MRYIIIITIALLAATVLVLMNVEIENNQPPIPKVGFPQDKGTR